MKHNKILALSILGAALSLVTSNVPVQAEQFYFKVQNSSNTAIKELSVSQDNKNWGYFDVGTGIAAGTTDKLIWDKSTNNEACEQWIKAVYADGSKSEPAKFDFCQDMNDPIVFQ
jgi:hypothetical protein